MKQKYLIFAKISLGIILFAILSLTSYYGSAQGKYSTREISSKIASTVTSMRVIDTREWQYAAKAAPPGLMEQVLKENTNPDFSVDAGRMKILKISLPGQTTPLFVINSRVLYECPPSGCSSYADPLCGTAGCEYFVYLKEGKLYRRVFKNYLKDLLPPELPFLRVSEQLNQGLPCLEFTENMDLINLTIRTRRFCYDGQNFVLNT